MGPGVGGGGGGGEGRGVVVYQGPLKQQLKDGPQSPLERRLSLTTDRRSEI